MLTEVAEPECETVAEECPVAATPASIDVTISELEQMLVFLRENRDRFAALDCGSPMLSMFLRGNDRIQNYATGLGKVEKTAAGEYFWLRKNFGNALLDITATRDQVCHRVETQVTKPAEPERIIPALPKRVETVVSWECPESLLGAAQ